MRIAASEELLLEKGGRVMAGKIVPLVISGILLFSISVPLCFADEDAEINKQKRKISSHL
jgi:hypothetical protein